MLARRSRSRAETSWPAAMAAPASAARRSAMAVKPLTQPPASPSSTWPRTARHSPSAPPPAKTTDKARRNWNAISGWANPSMGVALRNISAMGSPPDRQESHCRTRRYTLQAGLVVKGNEKAAAPLAAVAASREASRARARPGRPPEPPRPGPCRSGSWPRTARRGAGRDTFPRPRLRRRWRRWRTAGRIMTASAPRASILSTSTPVRTPPSTSTAMRPLTAAATPARTAAGARGVIQDAAAVVGDDDARGAHVRGQPGLVRGS